MAIPRLKAYPGHVLLSYGFRPFFFLGSCYAALAMAVWLPFFEGELAIATAFAPRDWHVHEMLFGYLAAVVTGFLLTAIPNWTGRLPLQGMPVLVLMLVWLAGRIAVGWSAHLGWAAAALIDNAFLLLVVLAAAREVIAGRNWRNLKVLAPVGVLALANTTFHAEAHYFGVAEFSTRAAIAAILVLIMLVGGRIVPSFTRNWLSRENPGRLPRPFGRFDVIAIASGAAALGLWVAQPLGLWTGILFGAAGVLHAVRLARWAGERATRDRLVFILHVAYAFIPLGFVFSALAAFGITVPSAGLHAFMVGAAGTMTLAVMTRASLGHTGRALVAGGGTQALYAAVVVAACARVAAVLTPAWTSVLLAVAAMAWIAAFGGFALLYGPLLFTARQR